MQNSQLRVSPRAPFWAVSGEQRACHPESYHMAPQPSLLPHFQLHPFFIPVKNKCFSYCLSHHTLSGLKTRLSAWNALSFPAWQTPTHPSKPNVHDSSSGRSQDRTNLSLFFFFCIRTRLERPTIPDPHTAGIWLAQGSAPLPPPHSLKPQHRLSPDCLQALDSRLAWPMFSQTPWSKAVLGEPRDAVFLCAWGVREQRGQWSRTSQPGALKAAHCHGNRAPWASQARAGQ